MAMDLLSLGQDKQLFGGVVNRGIAEPNDLINDHFPEL